MGSNKWAALGCVLGLAVYLLFCVIQKTKPDLRKLIESPVYGALIFAGFHLAYCVLFSQNEIAHIVDGDGNRVRQAGLVVEVGELHSIHIFIAGVATIYLGAIALFAACKHAGQRDE